MALLVALAVLAERAAARSLPVRCIVLFILRLAETVVEDFVFEATGLPPAIGGISAAGNAPEDALRLALRLRMLAAMLAVLLPVACRLDRWPSRRGSTSGSVEPDSGASIPEPNDTS